MKYKYTSCTRRVACVSSCGNVIKMHAIQYYPGPFHQGPCMVIHIQRCFYFAPIQILMRQELQNFVHDSTVILSWHAQGIHYRWAEINLQQMSKSIDGIGIHTFSVLNNQWYTSYLDGCSYGSWLDLLCVWLWYVEYTAVYQSIRLLP